MNKFLKASNFHSFLNTVIHFTFINTITDSQDFNYNLKFVFWAVFLPVDLHTNIDYSKVTEQLVCL